MKNTGKQYESLVEQVFSQLMEQDSVKNIAVERNKIIKGKSTDHEIDVYWEFTVGGITYSTIIQAKDWAQKVPQGEMLKLKAILEDLPGQPRGIFVTKTGYQSGTLDVAKANGIIAYELRKPTDDDWEGRIKTIVVTINATQPDAKLEIIQDEDWLQTELKRLNLNEVRLSVTGLENEIIICEEDGSRWKSIYELENLEIKKLKAKTVREKVVTLEMEQPRYLQTGNPDFPRLKLKAVQITINQNVLTHTFKIDGTTMVGYILKNMMDGSEIILDHYAKVKQKPA